MPVSWNGLRRATVVSLAMCLGVSLGCRAEGSEEARGDVVIERVSDPLRVVEVDLGRAIGPDNRVIEPTDEFHITDTIYASVVMLGRANEATLKARWTQESGEVIDETVRTVTPIGETITEFHLVQPAGWAKGKYRVEILLDDATVGREEFEIT
ncbi:MAG TPA: hypothetical protein VJ650_03605 [Gemmatimonadaceae bacterium]|nr:hypothetical protein [Gemmatimonadaceae bacterium]